jgi:hypothetical protein
MNVKNPMKAVLLASWLASLLLVEVMKAGRLWSVPGVELGVEVGVEMKQHMKRNAEQCERSSVSKISKRSKLHSDSKLFKAASAKPQSANPDEARQPSRMLRLSCPSQASVPSVSCLAEPESALAPACLDRSDTVASPDFTIKQSHRSAAHASQP